MISGWDRGIQRILLFCFETLYHQLAWGYDFVAAIVSAGMWKSWVRSALDDIPPGRILELGPGPGHLLSELRKRGRRPIGLELSPAMLSIARRRLTIGGRPANLVRGDANQTPFASQYFDAVVATFPAGYIFKAEFQKELMRLLKPGGQFILLTLAEITGRRVHHRAMAWFLRISGVIRAPGQAARQLVELYNSAGFSTALTIRELENSRSYILSGRKPK